MSFEFDIDGSGNGEGARTVQLKGGRIAMAWVETSSAQSDGSSTAIRVRVFERDGTAVSDSVIANSVFAGTQATPVLAAAPDGGFLVGWEQNLSYNEPSSFNLRGFDADGKARWSEKTAFTMAHSQSVSLVDLVALNGPGDPKDARYGLIWENNLGDDGNRYFRELNFKGRPVDWFEPPVALLKDQSYRLNGNTKIVQTQDGFRMIWTDGEGVVKSRAFEQDGTPDSRVTQLNLNYWGPAGMDGAELANGDVIVVTAVIDEHVGKGVKISLNAQILGPGGVLRGSPFKIDERELGEDRTADYPRVTALADGGFVVSWIDQGEDTIYARRFGSDYQAIGGEFRLDATSQQHGGGLDDLIEVDEGWILALRDTYRHSDLGSGLVGVLTDLDGYRAPIGRGNETPERDTDDYYVAGDFLEWRDSPGGFHMADDWNLDGPPYADRGKPVNAFAEGQVIYSSFATGYGKTVILDHGVSSGSDYHLYSLYAHLDSFQPAKDADGPLASGDQLGTIGKTGTTVPHLHFEIVEAQNSIVPSSGSPALLDSKFGGGYLNQNELDRLQTITYDDQGKVTSIVHDEDWNGKMTVARWFSTEYFLNVASQRERVFLTQDNDVHVVGQADKGKGYEIFGLSGRDAIKGGGEDDLLSGGYGNDTLRGAGGDDFLFGDRNRDILRGQSGNDTLFGGHGADRLIGGAAADTFTYVKVSDSLPGSNTSDWILDFDVSEGDIIDLSAIDASATLLGDQSFIFLGSTAGNTDGRAGVVSYTTLGADTVVSVFLNADSIADMQINLTGLHGLTADQFDL
ncbi:MAG: peptidoglycan DD-metalloendopeptidase family protein [Rhodobacteraceae bacterium]|nr:peptidoglycan DD-metalloendopeptidase family protein [Paracoccaceae bacterium]